MHLMGDSKAYFLIPKYGSRSKRGVITIQTEDNPMKNSLATVCFWSEDNHN